MAGLSCARSLADHGVGVTVFDKARGPGGRMSRRRVDLADARPPASEGAALQFDHGATTFTATGDLMQRSVQAWREQKLVEPFTGRLVDLTDAGPQPHESGTLRWVCPDGMSAICKELAEELDYRPRHRIETLEWHDEAWSVATPEGSPGDEFDAVVLAMPAPQAAALLGPDDPLHDRIAAVEMLPTWTLMIAVERTRNAPDHPDAPPGYDAAFINLEGHALQWVMRSVSNPARQLDAWVAHARHVWSQRYIDLQPSEVQPLLIDAWLSLPGFDDIKPSDIVHAAAHRWRYAATKTPLETGGEHCLWDADRRLGVCGDWCEGNSVEAARISGVAMASRLLDLVLA